jgi:hypothetical protein
LFFLAYANVSTGRANRVVSENCPDAMAWRVAIQGKCAVIDRLPGS